MRGLFTNNSKGHLRHRGVSDIHHSDLFNRERSLYPKIAGQRVGDGIPDGFLRALRAGSERNHANHTNSN